MRCFLEVVSESKKNVLSSVTGTLRGAPSSFQFGKSSLIARGSSTAPDKICAPTSEPFQLHKLKDRVSYFQSLIDGS